MLERTGNPTCGSIRAGKGADVVILDAEPVVDIYNADRISNVMRAGKWVE